MCDVQQKVCGGDGKWRRLGGDFGDADMILGSESTVN